jgi:trimeric autotransporter adhesin
MNRQMELLVRLLLCSGIAISASAQCTPAWAVAGVAGTNGPVNVASWWDRDGSGPQPQVLVVGGAFAGAGTVAAANIAWFDASSGQWHALGGGLAGAALALAGLPNGDLVVGGAFNALSGGPGEHIALWNGSNFVPMGSGCNGRVHALAVLPNGDVIAAGDFTQAGGQAANHVARWDGTTWSPLGSGTDNPSGLVTQPPVSCLAVMPNGDVVAGGRFTSAGGVPASCIARWNGLAWSALGSGVQNPVPSFLWNPIDTLLPRANGELLVGGQFSSIGGTAATNVARWNGTTWTALGAGVSGPVLGLAELPNGDSLAAGANLFAVQRWNGSAWSSVGGPSATVNTLAGTPSGKVAAGGSWSAPGANITVYDGVQWGSLGSAGSVLSGDFNNSPLCIGELANGDLLVGGSFSAVDGVPCSGLARHDGSTWSAFGSFAISFPAPFPQLNALARTGNGDLLAGGFFSYMIGVPGNTAGIARWNGSSWQTLGTGLGGTQYVGVHGIATTANGHAIVCGQFPTAGGLPVGNVARWNGIGWSTLGSGANGRVDCAVEMPNGDIVVSGPFTQAGGINAANIARWNGTTWSPLGSGLNAAATGLAVLPNGNLVAAGNFSQAGGAAVGFIARWDGASWSSLGGGMNNGVENLMRLPDGDLLATGPFTLAGATPAVGIARWDGATWQPVAGGVGGYINGIHLRRSGDVVVVGTLGTVGGMAAGELATLRSPCPATATTVGAGCAGSNGIDTLQATTLPWTGSVLRTVASGLPTDGLAVVVFGNTGVQVPLAPILPIALAGCDLLASPDVLDARLVVGTQLTIDLPIPDLAALAGISLRQQTVAFAVDAQGNLIHATSSNALQLTIGTW